MTIELPQYLSESERLEYIKILQQFDIIASNRTGLY